MRRATPGRVVSLGLASVLLVACGADGDAEDPAAAPASPTDTTSASPAPTESASPSPTELPSSRQLLTPTKQQLRAALPEVRDVPGAKKRQQLCPGSEQCTPGRFYVAFPLRAPKGMPAAKVEATTQKVWLPESAAVSVEFHRRTEPARKAFTEAVREARKYDGRYDIAPKDQGNGRYSAGQRGRGSLTEATVAGHHAVVLDRRVQLVNPNGQSSAGHRGVRITVRHGTALINVLVTAWEMREQGYAEDLARTLLEGYLDRLLA